MIEPEQAAPLVALAERWEQQAIDEELAHWRSKVRPRQLRECAADLRAVLDPPSPNSRS